MCIVLTPPPVCKRNSPCPCGKTNSFGPIKFKRCCGKGIRAASTPTTPVIEFLKAVTYPWAWGEEKILCTSKQQFIAAYNRGERRSLNNGDFQDHFDGIHKIYFMGNPFNGAKCLGMIDIDIQKALKLGTQKGAEAFAKKIDQLFKDDWKLASLCKIYWEPSSNCIGLAGYFLLHSRDVDENRQTFDYLQDLLKEHAKVFDIEGVEVKGKPPKITYGDHNLVGDPQINDIVFGSLAKYPTKATIDDLKMLPSLHCSQILSIPMPQIAAPRSPAKQVKSETPKVSPKPATAGSYQPLKRDYLDKLPIYRKLAEWLMPRGEWQTSDQTRAVVSSEDVAIHLLILNYLTETEDDLAKPIKRIMKIWESLVEGEYTDRPFNCHRHKVIRGQLTILGLIDWHDNEYYRHCGDSAPGKACQYSASALCKELIEKFSQQDSAQLHSIPLATELPALKRLPLISPKRVINPCGVLVFRCIKPPIAVEIDLRDDFERWDKSLERRRKAA